MRNSVNIQSLDPMKFTKLLENRHKAIAEAPAAPLPKDYHVNRVARMMHPETQYLKVSKVTAHGADAKSFELVPDRSRGSESCAWFSAGQYLCVHLLIGGARVSKPYSIRSSPRQALEGRYILTVKRVDGGFASEYILDNWTEGTQVEASGPEGDFRYEPLRDAPHVVGLAGGSGITPFHSLARAIAEGDEDCSLTLLYGSRTSQNILLKEEFDELAARCPRVKIIHVLSDEQAEGYESGFLSADLIKKYAPSGEYSLFLCGPQAMYRFVDKEIEKLGLAPKWVRHELFGEYRNPEKEPGYPQEALGKTFSLSVKIRDTTQTIPAAAGETLLVAMERAGIAAPSRCRSGECGFCHSRLVSGNCFIPPSVDGRRLADAKFGYVHPCCTFPVSDLVLEVPVK